MKLLVCDVEGTIFKAKFRIAGTDYPSTMWQPIAAVLGESAMDEERKTHEKWENLEYSNYLEWVKATIDIHRKWQLKQKDFNDLIKAAEYNEGVEEFFLNLNRKEWLPVFISGGFQNLIRRAQNDLDVEYGFGACEYFFDDYGYLQDYNIQPTDFDGKIHFLDILLKTYKLNKTTDWVFIGDGKNDEAIAKIAPLAFGIYPHEKLKSVPGLIEINSFMDIIPHLNKMESKMVEKTIRKQKPEVDSIKQKPTDEISRLKQTIFHLRDENRKLKQKINDSKGKELSHEKQFQVPISQSDYEKTSRVALPELLKGLHVTFIGLKKDYVSYKRLQQFSDLNLVPVEESSFNSSILKNSDFIFIYKNCIAHSAIWRALENSNCPYCLLQEHTSEQLLSNGLANVLHRYIYENKSQ